MNIMIKFMNLIILVGVAFTNLIARSQINFRYGQVAPKIEAGGDEKLIFNNFIWPNIARVSCRDVKNEAC